MTAHRHAGHPLWAVIRGAVVSEPETARMAREGET